VNKLTSSKIQVNSCVDDTHLLRLKDNLKLEGPH